MNILMIGNSYTVDCSRYLHRIARAGGEKLDTTCLYIGGCPLERHFRNMHSGEEAYELYVNGEPSGFKVSLAEALTNRSWDVITFQQASFASFDYETYQPYLDELADYARILCPKAKFIIHQTWPDADTSPRLEGFGFENNGQMFKALEAAYEQTARAIGAEDIVRDGQLIYSLYEAGLRPVWRDNGHISLGIGRYAAGLLWYKKLTGKDIWENTFADFDEPISPEEVEQIKKCVSEIQ